MNPYLFVAIATVIFGLYVYYVLLPSCREKKERKEEEEQYKKRYKSWGNMNYPNPANDSGVHSDWSEGPESEDELSHS